jgi:hypothetical protein
MRTATSTGAFSPAVVLGLIIVSVFSFAAFFALSAFAPDLENGDDGGAHALSKSAVGYGALIDYLREIGTPAVAPRGQVSEGTDGVIVYTPPTPEALSDAVELDAYAIALVVMPKWATIPDPAKKGWVRKVGPMAPFTMPIFYSGEEIELAIAIDEKKTAAVMKAADAFGGAILNPLGGASAGALDGIQYAAPNDAVEPILVAGEGRIILGKLKDAPVYVLTEPDLLNTYGLGAPERAHLAASLLDMIRAGGPVVFDLTLHGIARPRNIVRLALEPPLLSATLCALFAALLLALASATRFGPPARAVRAHDFGKSALAENSAALIRMAGRETAFGARYGALIRRRIAKALGAAAASPSSVDALIERLAASKGAGAEFSALMRSISQTRDPARLVQDARRLRRIEEELVP